MLRYLINRLIMAAAVALTVSVIGFLLLRASGDLAATLAGENASAADVAEVAKLYGLDKPLYVQYFHWVGDVLSGDLGKSLFTGESVADLIMNRIGPTLILASFSLIVALALGVPLGVISAARPNSWVDRATAIFAVSGQAIPNFWFGLVLIVVFSVWLRWTPVSGSETWANFILPVATLGLSVMPQFVRITRNEMLEALGADYIRTARSKGIRPSRVLFRHALRNAALPVVSLAAVTFGFLLGGTVIVESVFGINGLGLMAFEGILSGDFPIVQMVVVMIALAYVALNLLADVINVWLDPRLRAE